MQKIQGNSKGGERLDVCVSNIASISRAQSARLIEMGGVTVNGVITKKTSLKPKETDLIEVEIPQATEMDAIAENIPLKIYFEDEYLAVVDKPYGMVVHPAAGNETGTLVNALLYHMPKLSGIGGVKRPGIVHRLDKDTSGIILIAKTDEAHQSLSKQLKDRTMDKRYLAVVEGLMKVENGEINEPIARSKRDRKMMAIDKEGRQAHTKWKLIENLRSSSLLEVHILTGRTHQIRVHMQSIHHPVAGDPIYGAKKGVKVPRLMLHAHKLTFTHPITNERLTFTAPPTAQFNETIERLKKY